MLPEFGRKWGTDCLNTRFPLPTLQCAGYSVKLIYLYIYLLLRFGVEAKLPPLNTPPEFGEKWPVECLNTRLPMTTLILAGYMREGEKVG